MAFGGRRPVSSSSSDRAGTWHVGSASPSHASPLHPTAACAARRTERGPCVEGGETGECSVTGRTHARESGWARGCLVLPMAFTCALCCRVTRDVLTGRLGRARSPVASVLGDGLRRTGPRAGNAVATSSHGGSSASHDQFAGPMRPQASQSQIAGSAAGGGGIALAPGPGQG